MTIPRPPRTERDTRRTVPLARALSKLGLASRTEAYGLIANGRVRIDGALATDPSTPVIPERIRVEIDDVRAVRRERRVLAFHKPRGVVTTRRDPEGRPTVFDVLGAAGRGLVAVGRLDMASTGLLILTNDTRLADWLTDPTHRVPRRYVVTVRGRVEDITGRRVAGGISVPASGGRREQLRVESLEIRKVSSRETHLIVTLTEGKNRELRRIFEAVGHEVTRLHRISFGKVQLGTLAPGEHRDVTDAELRPAQ